MSVLAIKGQANAAVVVKGLLQQHGMPALTPEGVDALSTRFAAGLVIGNGVVSFNGQPLIDSLRAIQADAENRRFFVGDQTGPEQAGNLTQRYCIEIAESRKRARITDADVARYRGVTREHLQERQRAAQQE